VRLLLEKSHDLGNVTPGSARYFTCHDIALATGELAARGVKFYSPRPSRTRSRMPADDLWMAFFEDPDGHTLALNTETPKGHVPPTD